MLQAASQTKLAKDQQQAQEHKQQVHVMVDEDMSSHACCSYWECKTLACIKGNDGCLVVRVTCHRDDGLCSDEGEVKGLCCFVGARGGLLACAVGSTISATDPGSAADGRNPALASSGGLLRLTEHA